LGDESTSDFRLIVEGKIIFTHRQVLRNCVHFAAMLDSGMRESSTSELAIEDFSWDQVNAALQVIYTGQCEVTSENAVELLEIADFYKLVRFQFDYLINQSKVIYIFSGTGVDEVQV
jgi:kelch-like protein 24/35